MTNTESLATATPAEIDAKLAKIQAEIGHLTGKVAQRTKLAGHYAARGYTDSVADIETEIAALDAKISTLAADAAPLNAEFVARGGWTRAFLVNNSGGHVHRTRSCATCFVTTEFVWLTDMSDTDEQGIVDAAGDRACTVCYATAPVELRLDRPSAIHTPAEVEKLAERERRAAKRAAAEAAVVLHPTTGAVLFKTERGATNAIMSELKSLVFYGPGHPSARSWVRMIETAIAGLALKGVEYDYDANLAKARKSTVAECRKYGNAEFEPKF